MNDQTSPKHYQTKIQAIDFIQANNLNFCEGNIIKYITRYKEKNGKEDLLKARQYLDFLIKDYEDKEKNYFKNKIWLDPNNPLLRGNKIKISTKDYEDIEKTNMSEEKNLSYIQLPLKQAPFLYSTAICFLDNYFFDKKKKYYNEITMPSLSWVYL
jgi:hypothetical protein